MAVSLWIRSEVFDYGLLHLSFYSRLNYNNLLKLAVYAKTKDEAGYPRLSYPVWRHVACNKLKITEEHAWLLFKTFYLMTDWSRRDRINWITTLADDKNKTFEQRKKTMSVKTLEFLLFLRIQQFTQVSLKSSLVTGDEWPNRSKSPDFESKNYPGRKQFDENKYLSYITSNLKEFLQLLVEPETVSENDQLITIDGVDALGFLIEGQIDSTIMTVRQIASMSAEASRSGFSKICNTFSFRRLESWLRSKLSDCPFGTIACLVNGERLPRSLGSISPTQDTFPPTAEQANKDDRSNSASPRQSDDLVGRRGRILSNCLTASLWNRLTLLVQVCKQTVIKSSEVDHSGIKIYRCHYSYIYLLAPLRSVTIEKCRHSTIVLGAVETTVHCIACDHVTLIATCHQLYCTSCNDCKYYVCTPSKPVVLSGNTAITFGPYNTYYPQLSQHMQAVGLHPSFNIWNEIIQLGPLSSSTIEPCYSFVSLEQFRSFVIPITAEGETKCNPCAMPDEYAKALVERTREVSKWHQYLKERNLNENARLQFKKFVEGEFEDWLLETGNIRQLEGIMLNAGVGNT